MGLTRRARLKFDVELVGSGAASPPPAWGKFLRGCGFAETIVAGNRVEYTPVNDKISESATKAAQSSLYDWIRSAKGGKDAISDFGQHVLDTFARIASQRIADAVFNPIIDSLVGAVFGPTTVAANAKGGVYSGPGIAAYSGTIVDRPTLFAFARGAGLMGEAGPEAILPLDRDSTGKLR